MGIFKDDEVDLSKVKPQPYESFDEQDRKREESATEVYEPLTDEQRQIVREQSGINPVEQFVEDVVNDVAGNDKD
ncbi:GTP cyclohydrolase I FolE2 [Neisseria yangbaofengii]|uniref:GTP cyclohydrolase I FolE2 n=1 Tax=Neisseria yangbaofengii TaxID=2709396 RepID=UPI0013EDD292|nr:GTP cyclohydrolase I FolE2 [Neisseria yangbaofengii]